MLLAAAAGTEPHPLLVLPFLAMLAAIAIVPIALQHHWERFYHLIAAGLGAISAGYYFLILRQPAPMLHVAMEYLSFMAMIGSLYVVCGGIHLGVKGQATPAMNCLLLAVGAVLANVIGTTGASMLLVRPWLRMNKFRVTAHHVVFFIFIVSNVGGCLTPIGDPPLFLGYLKGVPFWWVAEHLWRAWLLGIGCLLAVFYVFDRRNFHRAPRAVREDVTARETWSVQGLHNVVFLGVILVAVFQTAGLREALMAIAALGSWLTTRRCIHEANHFTFAPVKEVAWLFAGIFVTMVPALRLLELHAPALGMHSPLQFYWLTGVLSGVLDNAPTYLAFLATGMGAFGLDPNRPAEVGQFVAGHGQLLSAISLGAVFFGALTYLGNGPNLMVKAIAEQQKVATPGFLGYVLCYALPILLPLLFVVGVLMFSSWRVW